MAAIYDAMGNVIGDDGVSEGGTPAVVTGSNVGWYQQKVTEFQNALISVDQSAQALETLLVCDITEEQVNEIQARLSEYYVRRSVFRTTAEAFNMAASLVNSVGGNMPSVQIPSGLGLAPVVIPAAVAAAIAGAALLITWASGWTNGNKNKVREILELMQPGPDRDAAAAAAAQAAAASDSMFGNALSGVSGVVMWLAIGVGAWFIYQSVNKGKR